MSQIIAQADRLHEGQSQAMLASLEDRWVTFPEGYEFRIVNRAVDGAFGLSERIDEIGGEGVSMPVPVMRVAEVKGGRMVHWRDCFDTGLLGKIGAGEDVARATRARPPLDFPLTSRVS